MDQGLHGAESQLPEPELDVQSGVKEPSEVVEEKPKFSKQLQTKATRGKRSSAASVKSLPKSRGESLKGSPEGKEVKEVASPRSSCSIPAAQPDSPSASMGTQLKEVDLVPKEIPEDLPTDLPSDLPTDVTHLDEQLVEAERLDGGFRAGLRLLHREELCRACVERGLDSTGTKGEVLNRLLEHFARAPMPTPTQDLSFGPPPKPSLLQPEVKAAPKRSQARRKARSQEAPEVDLPPLAAPTVLAPAPKVQAPPVTAPKVPAKVQPLDFKDLRPLQSTVQAPVLRTLLSRPRTSPAPAAGDAPNFSALWRAMCHGAGEKGGKAGPAEGQVRKKWHMLALSVCFDDVSMVDMMDVFLFGIYSMVESLV